MAKTTITMIGLASMLVLSGIAEAQRPGGGPPGRGPGPQMMGGPGWGGGGGGMGMSGGCARLLLHGYPAMLKANLGLNDSQVSQIQNIRKDYLSKRIKWNSQLQQYRLEIGVLWQSDIPDTKKVLDVQRKMFNVRNQMKEEWTKTLIRLLQVMTKEQRNSYRIHCPNPIGGMGMGTRYGQGGMGWGGW